MNIDLLKPVSLLRRLLPLPFMLVLPAAVDAASAEPVDAVDPFIGTVTRHPGSPGHGLGKTIPGPCTPYGLVQLGPDTVTGGDNGSGYNYAKGRAFTVTAKAAAPGALRHSSPLRVCASGLTRSNVSQQCITHENDHHSRIEA